nr:hypothetical protein [uncultured Megasphaera sp.]
MSRCRLFGNDFDGFFIIEQIQDAIQYQPFCFIPVQITAVAGVIVIFVVTAVIMIDRMIPAGPADTNHRAATKTAEQFPCQGILIRTVTFDTKTLLSRR